MTILLLVLIGIAAVFALFCVIEEHTKTQFDYSEDLYKMDNDDL